MNYSPQSLVRRLLKGLAMTALTVLVVALFNIVRIKDRPTSVELEYRSWLAKVRTVITAESKDTSSLPQIAISVEGTSPVSWHIASTSKLQDSQRILRLLDLLSEARLSERAEVPGSPVTVRVRDGSKEFVYSLTDDEVQSNLQLQLFLRLGREYSVPQK